MNVGVPKHSVHFVFACQIELRALVQLVPAFILNGSGDRRAYFVSCRFSCNCCLIITPYFNCTTLAAVDLNWATGHPR